VGHLEFNGVSYSLADGRPLLADVTFRVGPGQVTALIGPNGTGKTTLLRIAAGDLLPEDGAVGRSGSMAVMPQFIGSVRDDSTVRDLLLSVSSTPVRAAAAALDEVELEMMADDSEPVAMRYAQALADWGDVDGYSQETAYDVASIAALGVPYDRAKYRAVTSLSGGEQKRLVLELLLAGPAEVLLLDEPDNYLDVPAKLWLEEKLAATGKAVLLVSHDRELLARGAWNQGWPARCRGCMAAPSRRTTRPGTIGIRGWRNCVDAGMRNTPSSRRWC
jgi:ATPase subunit of ABC transporter with duplicated ATPase domains